MICYKMPIYIVERNVWQQGSASGDNFEYRLTICINRGRESAAF